MSFLSVDFDGTENLSLVLPQRYYYDQLTQVRGFWNVHNGTLVELEKGSIKDLIGKTLTWEDEPYEI